MNGSDRPSEVEQALNDLGRAVAPARPLAQSIMPRLEPLTPQRRIPTVRRWIMRTTIGIAAAVAVAITLIMALTPPRVAFAQVLEKVEQTRTLTGDIEAAEKMHLSISGFRVRLDMADGKVSMGNRETGQWLVLDATKRQAMKINMVKQPFDMYTWFRDFKNGKEERLGEREIGGKKVPGFKVTRPLPAGAARDMIELTVWVDAQANLPMEIEGSEGGKAFRITNLKWDEPLDEKLFAMSVPEGWKVDDMGGVAAEQLKAPPPASQADQYLLKPDVGMGGLNFGDSPERVIEVLGKPETVRSDIDWGYPSKGFWISASPRDGVWSVMATSKKAMPMYNVNDFIGRTDKQIGMGSTREQVETAYGKPERIDASGPRTTLYYNKPQIWFSIEDGSVVQIYMSAPRAAILKARERAATRPAATQPGRLTQ